MTSIRLPTRAVNLPASGSPSRQDDVAELLGGDYRQFAHMQHFLHVELGRQSFHDGAALPLGIDDDGRFAGTESFVQE